MSSFFIDQQLVFIPGREPGNGITPTMIQHVEIFEDGGAICLARILNTAGGHVQQSDLSAIACNVFDLDGATPSTPVDSPSVVISSAISNSLVTNDPRWTADVTGYNFIFTIPAAAFAVGRHRYRIEFQFTPASGEIFFAIWEAKTQAVYSG